MVCKAATMLAQITHVHVCIYQHATKEASTVVLPIYYTYKYILYVQHKSQTYEKICTNRYIFLFMQQALLHTIHKYILFVV